MKQSKVFIPTMREVPAEAEALSHRLLLKAGLIKQSSIILSYSFIPLNKQIKKLYQSLSWYSLDYEDIQWNK